MLRRQSCQHVRALNQSSQRREHVQPIQGTPQIASSYGKPWRSQSRSIVMSSRTNILCHSIAGPRVGWRMKLRAGVALICMATAFGSAGAVAEESISFPARSADLAANSYWTVTEFSEGCCTL